MKVKFFSIFSSRYSKSSLLYENFIYFLEKACGSKKDHTLIHLDGSNTVTFCDLMRERTRITHNILKDNCIAFQSDIDIIFLRDPFNYLLGLLDRYDIIFQSNSKAGAICGGFYLAKPSPLVIEFFNPEGRNSDRSRNDQVLFQTNKADSKFKGLKIKLLDPDLFVPGRRWYNNHKTLTTPYVVHYNWRFRDYSKILAMKHFNHWSLNRE